MKSYSFPRRRNVVQTATAQWQLSRACFVSQTCLAALFVLDRHWKRLAKTLDSDDFTDAQAIAAIERTKRGNFRLLERLFPQINRVLKINQLDTITDDVVEAAASILVVGN